MGQKKIGRPTDSPKIESVKFLADIETFAMLKECSEQMGVSRAEVIRRAIRRTHEELRKEQ